jgi:(2Fe-2S) ferredoxin
MKLHGEALSDLPVLITAAGAPGRPALAPEEAVDVLVYPANVRYHSLLPTDLAAFVQDQLIGGKPSARLRWTQQPSDQVLLLVCTHQRRDARCGRAGPPVC